MVENYESKKEAGNVSLEFAESGNIAVLERKFNPETGVPELKQTQETSVQHINDLIRDKNAQIAPTLAEIASLEAMLPDVRAKEDERAKIIAENSTATAAKDGEA